MARRSKLGLTAEDFPIEDKPMETEESSAPAVDPEPTPAAEPEVEKKPKGPQGRPKTKTEPEHRLGIAIPMSLWEKTSVAINYHGNNARYYILKLIEKDLKENYEKYLDHMNE